MNFTYEICENFFDFSRDLNRSNEIITSIYKIMLLEKVQNSEIFDGIERRLCRASNACMKADDFAKLANTAFRNLVIPFNTEKKAVYVALVFYVAEWLHDQSRLCVSGVAVEEIKIVILDLMAKKLTNEFRLETKMQWYKFVADSENTMIKPEEDNFDYSAFLFGIGLAYFMTKF